MTLQELILGLEKLDPAIVVKQGITNPHSWRGVYAELAFEPAENVSVGDMLASAKSAVGSTYEGYKGGDFAMDGYTDVHIDNEGEYSDRGLELWLNCIAQIAKPVVLTKLEQKAIDNINTVLNGDGQDPESGPGAWGDCGEVDVPILLSLVARLTK